MAQGSLLAFGRSYGPGGLGVEVGRPRGSAVYLLVFYEVPRGSAVYLVVFYEVFCMGPSKACVFPPVSVLTQGSLCPFGRAYGPKGVWGWKWNSPRGRRFICS